MVQLEMRYHITADRITTVQDELEEEILFQGLWGQVQVVIGMLQSSLAQSQVLDWINILIIMSYNQSTSLGAS